MQNIEVVNFYAKGKDKFNCEEMLLGLAECKPKIHSGNNNNNLKKVFPRTMSVGSLTMTCQNIKGYLLGKTVTTTKHENDSHLFRF
jgi:hypothetical protein